VNPGGSPHPGKNGDGENPHGEVDSLGTGKGAGKTTAGDVAQKIAHPFAEPSPDGKSGGVADGRNPSGEGSALVQALDAAWQIYQAFIAVKGALAVAMKVVAGVIKGTAAATASVLAGAVVKGPVASEVEAIAAKEAAAPAVENLVPSLRPDRPLGSTLHPFDGIPKALQPEVFDIIGDLHSSRAGDAAAAARLAIRSPHVLTGDLKGWTSLDIAGRSISARFLYKETRDGIEWMVRSTH
jgi:hypothetical protein